MKFIKIIYFILMTSMLMLPFINSAAAVKTPDYVGIEKGDEIIWSTKFDNEPFEDYLEDWGVPETAIDNYTDNMFNDETDTDVVGWKIKILEIEDEDEQDDNDYVEYKYKLYIREEDGDWEVEDQKEDAKIWKYDKGVYVDLVSEVWALMAPYSLVLAKNVDWDKVASKVDDECDDKYDGDDKSAGAEVATSPFFFMQKENGISTYSNANEEELDDFTAISKYNDDGILMYYNWAYDGDTFYEFELEWRIVYEWWWVAAVIAMAAVVTVMIIIIIRKR